MVGRLRSAHDKPEIWPLWAVGLMAAAVIALSALCGWLNDKAQKAADAIAKRVEEAQQRIDEDQRLAELAKREERREVR